jgi:hypothetical protein
MVGARIRDIRVPVAFVMVADFVSVIPGKTREIKPTDLADLEVNARLALGEAHVRDVQTERAPVLGTVGIRASGVVGAANDHVDVRVAYRGYRKVEFRCYYAKSQSSRPCDEAFDGIDVKERVEAKQPGEDPRVLHLRDEQFGIGYDPPDDTWLAVGPRTAMNGAQVVWIWNKMGRQIDVGATDFAALPRQSVDDATLVTQTSEGFRRHGMMVKIRKSKLSGRACFHLEMSRSAGDQQDLFLQRRGSVVYCVLVTAPIRDASLISRARAGLRISDGKFVRGAAHNGVAPNGQAPAAPARR